MKSNRNWHGLTVGRYVVLCASCNYLVVCLGGQMMYVPFVHDVYV